MVLSLVLGGLLVLAVGYGLGRQAGSWDPPDPPEPEPEHVPRWLHVLDWDPIEEHPRYPRVKLLRPLTTRAHPSQDLVPAEAVPVLQD